jgi:ribosomal-protein-alanine N-acetyltransferase
MAEEVATGRLRLVPATVAHLTADRATLSSFLGAAVPDDWPPETLADAVPVFLSWLTDDPASEGWNLWYIVSPDGVLAGSCGFVGRPSPEGEAEMGYAVLPAFRGRGYATEAAAALVEWAFAHPEVLCVTAQADPANLASVRVLEKVGFVSGGEGDEGCVRFVRRRERR